MTAGPGAGRSARWRVGALCGGLLLGACGVALVLRPELLSWAVAGLLGLLGLLFVLSALLARGPG